MAAQLEGPGFVERHANAAGTGSVRLTAQREQVANQLALTDEAGQDALLAALLEERES